MNTTMNTTPIVTPAEAKQFPRHEIEIVAHIFVEPAAHPEDIGLEAELDIVNPELRDSAVFPDTDRVKCGMCGANLKWASEAVHVPTMRGFFIGRECAHHISGLPMMSNMQARHMKMRLEGKRRLAKLQSRKRLGVVIEWAKGNDAHHIASDIIWRIRNDEGKLSFKAARLLVKLWRQHLQHEQRKLQWAEERANAPEIVEGRRIIEGTILKLEERESQWGFSWKMTIKTDDGNVFWGSLPSALSDCKKGDRVAFTATVEVSDRDPHFAFIKRPSKATQL